AAVHRQGARMVLLNLEEDTPWLSEPMAQLARELDVAWVDAGPALGEPRSHGIRLRLPGDPHWNAEGHAIIANVLEAGLCADTPLPGCDAVATRAAAQAGGDAAPRQVRSSETAGTR